MEKQSIVMGDKKSGPRKGTKFSDEHRRRISETKKRQFKEGLLPKFIGGVGKDNLQYGKKRSREQLRTMSERMKGERNPFYGKTHNKETIKKIHATDGWKNRKIPSGKEHWVVKNKVQREKWIQKIKKTNMGRKNAYLSARNKTLNPTLVGEKNPSWQGGVSFEPYDKTFNEKFRRAIRKRDNQICMLCNVHREKLNVALSVHHIDYDKLLSIPQNCVSLCSSCHSKTNHNRKHWKIFFQNLLSEKYNYKYKNEEVILEAVPYGERSGLF